MEAPQIDLFGDNRSKLQAKFGPKKTYLSTPQFRSGMNALIPIVGSAGMQDVKFIRDAETAAGAQRWINKRRLSKTHRVDAADVDGDGIADVVVKDIEGNPVIVNGYTLRPSRRPLRAKFYGQAYGDRGYTDTMSEYYRDEYYKPLYDRKTGKITGYAGVNPDTDPFTKKLIAAGVKVPVPRDLNEYQLFGKAFVKPIMTNYMVNNGLYYRDPNRGNQVKFPNIAISVIADAWNWGVVLRVLHDEIGINKAVLTLKPDQLQQLLKEEPMLRNFRQNKNMKTSFANAAMSYINGTSPEEVASAKNLADRIGEATDHYAKLWFAKKGIDSINGNDLTEDERLVFNPPEDYTQTQHYDSKRALRQRYHVVEEE